MSVAAFSEAMRVRGLHPLDKLTLIVLAASSSGFDGSCSMSIERLADEVGVSLEIVEQSLERLERGGHINRTAAPRLHPKAIVTIGPVGDGT